MVVFYVISLFVLTSGVLESDEEDEGKFVILHGRRGSTVKSNDPGPKNSSLDLERDRVYKGKMVILHGLNTQLLVLSLTIQGRKKNHMFCSVQVNTMLWVKFV
ncbi:hypothetical protein L2E82_06528 [Cichorium intybus]|uniref:Uncharacterized protein n=1 Tax=Cichorium intybus TaxID=13427 RepID=A0ACB9HBL5_CICIN|nr:hypothetical protein L2E82_06528 [Cichorium intybus]